MPPGRNDSCREGNDPHRRVGDDRTRFADDSGTGTTGNRPLPVHLSENTASRREPTDAYPCDARKPGLPRNYSAGPASYY